MQTLAALVVGAALGATTRYYITLWAAARFGTAFPYGTLIVNIAGGAILGFFLTLAATRQELSPAARLLISTGFCGSLTTFSTFSYETILLLQEGRTALAMVNIVGSLVAGLIAVVAGAALARSLLA